VMPVYAAIFMVMTMSSIGLPTLNGFIGEFLILQGAFIANLWWAVIAGSGVVLGAAYMLWLYQRTMFGKVENPKNENLPDMSLREIATFVPLIILAVWIGIYPKPFLDRLAPTVNAVVARVNPAYPAVAAKAADCDQNKPANPFVTAPCGDAAAPAVAPAAAVPAAAPAGAGGAPKSESAEPAPAGGRH